MIGRTSFAWDNSHAEISQPYSNVFEVLLKVDGKEVHDLPGDISIVLEVSGLDKFKNPGVLHIISKNETEWMDDVTFKKNSVTIRGVNDLSHFAIQERPEEKPPVVTPPVATTPVFADVPVRHWAEAAIRQVVAQGLMAGVGGNMFSPDCTVTRAQLVTVLYRAAGSPANGSGSFKDVPENAYFHDAVLWANANGIASGYGGGMFGPNDPLNREQMVTMLHRFASWSGRTVQMDIPIVTNMRVSQDAAVMVAQDRARAELTHEALLPRYHVLHVPNVDVSRFDD